MEEHTTLELLLESPFEPGIASIMVTPDACQRRKVLQAAENLSMQLWPTSYTEGIQILSWKRKVVEYSQVTPRSKPKFGCFGVVDPTICKI